MTREELKRHCEKQIEECERWAKHKGEEPQGKVYEEHKLILELLEQEPCEDAISRKKVLNTLFYNSDNNCEVVLNKELQDRIKSLPPVKPVACIATVKFSKEDMQEFG